MDYDQLQTVAHQDYWCYLKLNNSELIRISDWVLKFDLGMTSVDAYLRRTEGQIERYSSGYFNLTNRSYNPVIKSNVISIDVDPDEAVDLLIKLSTSRTAMPPILDMSLLPLVDYEKSLRYQRSQNLMYIGFILMMFMFTTLLYALQNDDAVAYYSIYLLFVTLFTLYNGGEMAEFFYRNLSFYSAKVMYFGKLTCYVLLFSYIMFVRVFLDLREVNPKWDHILKWTAYLSLPFCLLDSFLIVWSDFSPDICDKATVVYSIIFVIVTSVMLIPIWRLKDDKRLYIFFGVLFMNIGIAITITYRIQSHDFSTLPFKIGSVLEIIIFSLGIVFRQQQKVLEKNQAEFNLQTSHLLRKQEEEKVEQLQQLNEFKSTVFSNVSHEFKTPLTLILGMAERIQGYPKEKSIITNNGKELLSYVNEILELSKADNKQLLLHYKQSDVISYIDTLLSPYVEFARDKGVQISLQKTTDHLVMLYDESAIKHIFENLISNALKFTPNGGEIIVNLGVDQNKEDQFLIEVADSGSGIMDEDLPNIFERFYQGKNSQESNIAGSGIGLTLVRELVEIMGGSIDVSNKTHALGAIFKVLIPIKKEDQEALAEEVITEALNLFQSQDDKGSIILIADDNKDMVEYISLSLPPHFKVLTAYDGISAERIALKEVPDLLITDYKMPGQNGMTLSQRIHQDHRLNHVPVILITAHTDQEVKMEALRKGIDVVLGKPFDREELQLNITNLLRFRKLKQEQIQKSEQVSDVHPFIEKLQAFIIENVLDDSLNVEKLEEWSNMSKNQLYRKVRALVGMSTIQYINHVKLGQAAHLLRSTEMNIGEVAYSAGFKDPNYFTRIFSERYDMPPSEYRQHPRTRRGY